MHNIWKVTQEGYTAIVGYVGCSVLCMDTMICMYLCIHKLMYNVYSRHGETSKKHYLIKYKCANKTPIDITLCIVNKFSCIYVRINLYIQYKYNTNTN